MLIKKRLLAVLFSAALLLSVSVMTVCAHEVPDLSSTGSISVTMQFGDTAVPGGTLTIYRVGDIQEDDGDYSFALATDFAASGLSLEDIESADLAAQLAEYVEAYTISGDEAAIDDEGQVTMTDLELGLYLVVQTQAAEGYEPVDPFLVSLPMQEDGVYVYEVNATPKMSELVEAPVQTVDPQTPGTTLPQTGQLNWPIPVLVALGLVLFSLGWVLRYGKKPGHEK